MLLIAVKLTLAPSFVVGASLAARRFGARVGGLIGGLPVVAGPILLAYALAHGRAFAAGAAAGTLLGLVSLTAFVVVYGRLAGRLRWVPSLLGGWAAFILATIAFSYVSLPAGGALLLAGAALLVALAALPRPRREPTAHAPPLGPAVARRLRARAGARADRAGRVAGPSAERAARALPDHRHRARDVHARAARAR
jgi:hypothetical protein